MEESPKVLAQEQAQHLLTINEDDRTGSHHMKDSLDYRKSPKKLADAGSDDSGDELGILVGKE